MTAMNATMIVHGLASFETFLQFSYNYERILVDSLPKLHVDMWSAMFVTVRKILQCDAHLWDLDKARRIFTVFKDKGLFKQLRSTYSQQLRFECEQTLFKKQK
jgi:hypothetical protein